MSKQRTNLKDILIICFIPVILLSINTGMYTLSNFIIRLCDVSEVFSNSIASCISYIVCIGLFFPFYYMSRWNYKSHSIMPKKAFKKSLKEIFPSSSGFFMLILILLILLGLTLQASVTAILQFISYCNPDILQSYHNMIQTSFGSHLGIFRIFSVAVLAPIAEELAFRGFCMSLTAKIFCKKSYRLCIFITSVLFGLYHGNIIQAFYAIPMGLLLGTLTVMFSSILPSIILHISVNSSAYFLPDNLYQTKEMTVTTLIISSVFAIIFISVIYIFSNRCFQSDKT